jgi:hypothetical protein
LITGTPPTTSVYAPLFLDGRICVISRPDPLGATAYLVAQLVLTRLTVSSIDLALMCAGHVRAKGARGCHTGIQWLHGEIGGNRRKRSTAKKYACFISDQNPGKPTKHVEKLWFLAKNQVFQSA